MMYTRNQLIEKVNKKEVDFFSDLYQGYRKTDCENKFESVWELNWGDGNEWYVALNFPEENINILLEGYYSSHGESEFNKVSLAIPYEYRETRYKSVTVADIRDMNIDEVLKDE